MKYLCILNNEDTIQLLKIISCKNIENIKSIGNLSKPNKFVNIYKIEKTNKYKLKNIKYENIISIFCRNDKNIELLEIMYNIKLENMRKIKEFILDNNYINYVSINLLDIIIMNEFKKLGLIINKISQEDINIINKKNIKKIKKTKNDNIEKHESLLIKIISDSSM